MLNNLSGTVCPGQMMAVMGPSGCGKTTLLSILAKRKGDYSTNKLFGKAKKNGLVTINGSKYKTYDFCQLGAFVQQDDILFSQMTPKELFAFACRMRTTLDTNAIESRVNNLLQVLNLLECQDTLVGDTAKRGVSGSERKRVSIGYELITNPSLLILDEPTSGLDSNTALKVINLLKKEAQRGMTIITSIHAPSSEIFMKFDKVIVLSDGNQIYNDKPEAVLDYFQSLGHKLGKYVNPADELLKLANCPEKLKENLSVQKLSNLVSAEDQNEPEIEKQAELVEA